MILAAVVLTTASAWADKRAEGDALYEKFAHSYTTGARFVLTLPAD